MLNIALSFLIQFFLKTVTAQQCCYHYLHQLMDVESGKSGLTGPAASAALLMVRPQSATNKLTNLQPWLVTITITAG